MFHICLHESIIYIKINGLISCNLANIAIFLEQSISSSIFKKYTQFKFCGENVFKIVYLFKFLFLTKIVEFSWKNYNETLNFNNSINGIHEPLR